MSSNRAVSSFNTAVSLMLRKLPDALASVVDEALPVEQLCSLILRHEPFELCHVDQWRGDLVDEGIQLCFQ